MYDEPPRFGWRRDVILHALRDLDDRTPEFLVTEAMRMPRESVRERPAVILKTLDPAGRTGRLLQQWLRSVGGK